MTENNQPTPNIPLLRKAVEWVEQQAQLPEIDREWYQGSWRSSPEARAVYLADGYYDWFEVREQIAAHCGTAYCVAGYIGQLLDARYAESSVVEGVHVSDFAQKALGLRDQQLFHEGNDAEDVRRIAEGIAEERL